MAASEGEAEPTRPEETAPEEAPPAHKRESWYWGFALGYASPSFAGGLGSAYEAADSNSLVGGISAGAQLHFYWPVGIADGILGVAVSSAATVFSGGLFTEPSTFTVGSVGASYLHSFGGAPGTGFLLRGDVGIGTLSYSTGLDPTEELSENGLGLRAGIGYGLPLSDETRLVFDFAYGLVVGGEASYWAVSLGPLF